VQPEFEITGPFDTAANDTITLTGAEPAQLTIQNRGELTGELRAVEVVGRGFKLHPVMPSTLLYAGGEPIHFTVAVADPSQPAQATLRIETNHPDEPIREIMLVYHGPARPVGDVNGDGRFDSSDLVLIFQSGKYEDGIENNATYAEGDFNGDGDFDSSDLVFAFQSGSYNRPAAFSTRSWATAVDTLFHEVDLRGRSAT
jgi:hypothetical protein